MVHLGKVPHCKFIQGSGNAVVEVDEKTLVMTIFFLFWETLDSVLDRPLVHFSWLGSFADYPRQFFFYYLFIKV